MNQTIRVASADLLALGGGKVDPDGAAINLDSIHPLPRRHGALRRIKGDKAEATATPAVAIEDDLGIDDGTFGIVKGLTERLIGGAPGKVANEKAGTFFCGHVAR